MTINQNRIGKYLKFENGCGLHALIDCLIANLRNGNLNPKENAELRKTLEELHENCKRHAPDEFQPKFNCNFDQFVEYLKSLKANNKPVEATHALSRAMRQMLEKPELRKPNVFVADEDILKLGNRFNIQVEAYYGFEVWLRIKFLEKGIKNPTPEMLQKAASDMAKIELQVERRALRSCRPITEEEVHQKALRMQERFADDDQLEGVAQNVRNVPGKDKYIRLKLFNRKGDHWEREYNDEDTAEENRLAWENHNKAIDSFEAAENSKNEEATQRMLAEERAAEEREKEEERRRREFAAAQAAHARATQAAGLATSNANAVPNPARQTASGQSSSTSTQQGSIFTPLQTIFKAIGDQLETTSGGHGLFHFISLFVKWFAEIFEFLANGVNLAKQMKLPELFGNLFSGNAAEDEPQNQPAGSPPGPQPFSPNSDPSQGYNGAAFNQPGYTGSGASFTPAFNGSNSRNGFKPEYPFSQPQPHDSRLRSTRPR